MPTRSLLAFAVAAAIAAPSLALAEAAADGSKTLDAVRVTGTKRDDLQAAMALLKKDVTDVPISFNNFRD